MLVEMRRLMMTIFMVAVLIVNIFIIISLERKLSDTRFECNHLQNRLNYCQDLSDCAEIFEQILPPLAWAQVQALNEGRKRNRHKEYERIEQPLIMERGFYDIFSRWMEQFLSSV